jgi:hypothetical protein
MTHVKGGIETDGELDSLIRVHGIESGEVRSIELRDELMLMEFRQIDAEEKKQVGNLDPVDGAQAVELVNARYGIGILDLGEPAMGNVELRVAFSLGYSLAQLGDFARADSQSGPELFELLVRTQGWYGERVMRLALVPGIAELGGLYVSMAGKKFNNTYLGIDDLSPNESRRRIVLRDLMDGKHLAVMSLPT